MAQRSSFIHYDDAHMWHTEQPPDGVKTKHCPIDVPFFSLFVSLSEVNLEQHAVESGVTAGVTLMHYKAREVTSL